jgi:GcrA cell cycle regulator
MQIDWAPEHIDALREFLAKGMSFSQAAGAINAKFRTDYTRSAAIGRARRMGLTAPDRPADRTEPPAIAVAPRLRKLRERAQSELNRPMPVFERAKPSKLRCVGIVPRHLPLMDLEPGDCRYPYGGDADGEAITFCGHPRRPGSSYCTPHFHLTRGPGTAAERAACTILLRLVWSHETREPATLAAG